MFMSGDGPTFDYMLADRLHRTVAEIGTMPHSEYVGWGAYLQVRHILDDLAVRTAEHRRGS